MKKDDKADGREVVNVWEKIIEVTHDGEIVGYYFQHKGRRFKDEVVTNDDESGSNDSQGQD